MKRECYQSRPTKLLINFDMEAKNYKNFQNLTTQIMLKNIKKRLKQKELTVHILT
jgi:hypothetical protein